MKGTFRVLAYLFAFLWLVTLIFFVIQLQKNLSASNTLKSISTYFFDSGRVTGVSFPFQKYSIELKSTGRWAFDTVNNKKLGLSLGEITVSDKSNNVLLIVEGYDLAQPPQLEEYNFQNTNGEIQSVKTVSNQPYVLERLEVRVNTNPGVYANQTIYRFRTENSGFFIRLASMTENLLIENLKSLRFF